MRADIQPGAILWDFELPDHRRKRRRLSELQGRNNLMILTLNRGIYCPKDRMQLLELARFAPQLAVGFTRLVTITTDDWLHSNDLRLGVGATWPFLHDPERVVQRALDIQEYTDPHNDPMIPHTFVLEPNLVIYKVYNGYWYWGRPSTADLHADLRAISSRVRFDWDLGDEEVRAAWRAGERHRFYPYDKSLHAVVSEMGVGEEVS